MQEVFRAIPSVDVCLRALRDADAELATAPQAFLRDLAADFLERIRSEIRSGQITSAAALAIDKQLPALLNHVRKGLRPNLRRVLNGTGVIIHTNLGRSVLAPEAAHAAFMAAGSYTNLEMNLATGERGSRHDLTEDLIRRITGAEAALVVNNNAAAVLLMLDTLCANGEAIVSRGELVEIGGSFRIPDIMAKSGTTLREVGTTNRTHLKDYREAINERTKAIMRVHTSNYRVIGFHAEADLRELKALAQEHGLPLLFDLGSGSLLDLSGEGLPPEPTVGEIIAAGADCVSFSGDKVLGGPQAGIIAGKKALVDKFKKNPLTRALRCDKLCLSALEATLRLYLDPETARWRVPTPRMISREPAELARAARALGAKIRRELSSRGLSCDISYIKDVSRVGGGAFPECNLATTLVCLRPENCSAQQLRQRLLDGDPPLIGRLENDAFCLDPRALLKEEYGETAKVVAWALAELDSD